MGKCAGCGCPLAAGHDHCSLRCEREAQAGSVWDELDVVVKVTLWGPAPWGGSLTTTLVDPAVDRALVDGWTIRRVWGVAFGADGPFVAWDQVPA